VEALEEARHFVWLFVCMYVCMYIAGYLFVLFGTRKTLYPLGCSNEQNTYSHLVERFIHPDISVGGYSSLDIQDGIRGTRSLC
jgi:hypothetical protein